MKIGDEVYYYDSDYRSYTYEDGTKSIGAIEEHKYRKYIIIGETKISWIISRITKDINDINERNLKYGIKVKKKDSENIIFPTWEDVQKKLFMKNSWRIGDKVSMLREMKDYDKLKQIEEILNS